MATARTNNIETIKLDIQQLKQLQSEIKLGNLHSYQNAIVFPSKQLLEQQLEKKYPNLIDQKEDILNDVYYRLRKHIARLDIETDDWNINNMLWSLVRTECNLALPTAENKQKNLGLTRQEFKVLCAKLKAGDESLIEKVYLHHFKKCKSFLVYQDSASDDDAHNATLDALFDIRKDLMNDKIFYGNLAYYFTRRAKSKLFKMKQRKKDESVSIDDLEFSTDEDTEFDMVQEELAVLVSKAINQLCDECSSIIKQFYYEGKTLKEISENMGKSHVALRKQTTRCRDKLRKILGDNFYTQFSSFLEK